MIHITQITTIMSHSENHDHHPEYVTPEDLKKIQRVGDHWEYPCGCRTQRIEESEKKESLIGQDLFNANLDSELIDLINS